MSRTGDTIGITKSFSETLRSYSSIFTFLRLAVYFKLIFSIRSISLRRFFRKSLGDLAEPDLHKLSVNRIRKYAFGVPVIIESLCKKLTGINLNREDRENLCLAGIISPINDWIFDNPKYADSDLHHLTFNADSQNIKGKYESNYVRLIEILKTRVDNPEFEKYSEKVFNAQIKSRVQRTALNSINELDEVTRNKGGVSFLFYISTTKKILTDQQKEFVFSFGALVQLIDDIFDVYNDGKEGTETLATTNILKPEVVLIFLEEYVKKSIDALSQIKLSKSNKKKILDLHKLLCAPSLGYLLFMKSCSKHKKFKEGNILPHELRWTGSLRNFYQAFRALRSF
jgi:hypothetical protein